MKLAETIQILLEIEGRDVYYSDIFINMLDDFGAFIDMPFAKFILKQMWDKDFHKQIAKDLHNENNLRYTISRVIDNLNTNFGFDKYSLTTICNELLQGLNVYVSVDFNNIASECLDTASSKEMNKHLFFQGISMGNSIKILSSLLVRNNKYIIIEDKGNEIQMTGEFAGIKSSFIRLDSNGNNYTKSVIIGFYEEDDILRSMKERLLMSKLNCDYGQPKEDPICRWKWLSDGGFVYIINFQEVVAVVYMNDYTEISTSTNCDIIDEKLSIESTFGIQDIEILNFLSLLNTDYNPFLTSANGLALFNRKVSKYDDGVQWDIELGVEKAQLIILKDNHYDSVHSIRSILLNFKACDNWNDLYNKYKFYQSYFDKLFGLPVLSSETFDEYYQGEGDEINSLQEYSNGSFASWYFNYAGVVLVEIRNSQVRVGYFHLPDNIENLGKMCFMGMSIASPKQEIINNLITLGVITNKVNLIGSYNGYKAQYFLDEKFGKVSSINIRINIDTINNPLEVFENIRSNFIIVYGQPDFDTGPSQIGVGRYSKSMDWSSSFKSCGGSATIIWSKKKKIFLISFTDTILEQLVDYSEDFHKPVLLSMFE